MNIFDTIENNAIKNKYINNTAVTQITSANKIKAFLIRINRSKH